MEDDNAHPLERRSSRKVAQMLQQILQRGEMQVEPYRIHKFLGRLNRRRINDQLKHMGMNNLVWGERRKEKGTQIDRLVNTSLK